MSVGGLAISNEPWSGHQASADSGDICTGQTFGSDQFSQIELTSDAAERWPVDRSGGASRKTGVKISISASTGGTTATRS